VASAQRIQINSIDLLAYLTAIANSRPMSRLDELLPGALQLRVNLTPRGRAPTAARKASIC
jgi:hypothetical protein